MGSSLHELRMRQVLYDMKWKKFLRRARLFRHIPFVEFVLGAGSMAVGGVHKDSDFDVIVGVSRGRIFTARFFSVVAFGVFGWRRKKLTHDEAAADKICLNHFVTESSFTLAPPYNESWRTLYAQAVPIFGSHAAAQAFFDANAGWMGERRVYEDDARHRYRNSSQVKLALERLLGGALGNAAERGLKAVQIMLIRRSLRTPESGVRPRIRYTDEELEFHPDTGRNYRASH